MPPRPADLLRHLRRTVPRPGADPAPDAALLTRYVRSRDEDAFAALVARHGPMVLGACRRVLGDAHAAEDAFQATWLLLARRAGSVRPPERLGAWLYRVARRVAWNARRADARRRRREAGAAAAERRPAADPLGELTARELLLAVDEEVERLPVAYRLPVLLCYLGGCTQEEAARRLGWTAGAVKGRLERGRARLQSRLARRGLGPPAVAGPALLAAGPVPIPDRLLALAAKTAAAPEAVPPAVAALADGALPAAAASRWVVLAAAVAAGVAGAGIGLRGPQAPPTAHEPPPRAAAAPIPTPRADRYGDPLPDGALARLGTVRLRHRQSVAAVAFSPDGKWLASAGWDEAVRLWDVATGRPVRELADPQRDATFAIGFTPDGRRLATASERGLVRLWDVAGGRKLSEQEGHYGRGHGIAVAPDGRTFASAGDDGRVLVWNAVTGAEVRAFQGGTPRADTDPVAFSPDGKLLAAGFGRAVHVWGLAPGAPARTIPGVAGRAVVGLAFADRRTLVTAAYSHEPTTAPDGSAALRSVGSVRLWDAATGAPLRTLKADGDEGIPGIAVSPDGKLLAVAHRNGLRLWDLAAGRPVRALPGYRNHPLPGGQDLAFSPDGRLLAARADDCAVCLWEVASGRPYAAFAAAHTDPVLAAAFAPDGGSVATGSQDGTVRLWDPGSGRELRRLPLGSGQRAHVYAVGLGADGRTVVAAGNEEHAFRSTGLVGAWDRATGMPRPFRPLDYWVFRAALSPDGSLLAAVSRPEDGRPPDPVGTRIRVIETATGAERAGFGEHPAGVCAVAFGPGGRALVSVGMDGAVHVWDPATGRERHRCTVSGPRGWRMAAVSADGRRVAVSWMFTDLVVVAELPTGRVLRRLHVPRSMGSVLAFSPDGRVLATGSEGLTNVREQYDYGLHLWEVAGGGEILSGQPGSATARVLAFAPDGRRLLVGLGNGTALVWDATGRGGVRPPADRAASDDLAARWAELAGPDAGRAYRAVWALADCPDRAVPWIAGHLRPAAPASPERLARLLADLDSGRFAVRTQASAELAALADVARPALRKALAGRPTLEARRRIEQLLEADDQRPASPDALRAVRAVAVLEAVADAAAQDLLKALARGAPGARLTEEARASLDRLARRP